MFAPCTVGSIPCCGLIELNETKKAARLSLSTARQHQQWPVCACRASHFQHSPIVTVTHIDMVIACGRWTLVGGEDPHHPLSLLPIMQSLAPLSSGMAIHGAKLHVDTVPMCFTAAIMLGYSTSPLRAMVSLLPLFVHTWRACADGMLMFTSADWIAENFSLQNSFFFCRVPQLPLGTTHEL
jgi:hypothetical protein